jgi:hypothetical protein
MGNVAIINATVTNNSVNSPGTLLDNFNAFNVNSGLVSTDNLVATFYIADNNFAGGGKGSVSPNADDVRLRQRFDTTIELPGYTGPARDNTDLVVSEVSTYLAGLGNTFFTATANSAVTGGGFVGGGLPLLAAAGGDDPSATASSSPNDATPAPSSTDNPPVQLALTTNNAPTLGSALLGAPIDIGTLPAGQTVTIQWQATIDAQANQLIVNPVNQGQVTGDNFTSPVTTNQVTTALDTLTLGNLVFNDVNHNGVFDAGPDIGINGVTLTLFADDGDGVFDAGDTLIATTTTAGGGLYSFTGLAPGTYWCGLTSPTSTPAGRCRGRRSRPSTPSIRTIT